KKHGQLKTIGLMAKRARGTMARYIIQNRIDTPEALKNFTEDGYTYQADLSDAQNFVFVR
ncbi:MAG: peroxide stress protein YaaA, partial [Pseudomonadota bacterium]|nr:peroxide stress protein YaaA [Pseudomonadota bacterium]